MYKYKVVGLIIFGSLITLFSYIIRDKVILEWPIFAFLMALSRITSFSLLFFTTILLLALGKRFISKRFYWFGLFLVFFFNSGPFPYTVPFR